DARVLDANHDEAIVRFGAQDQPSASRHRMEGVLDDVRQRARREHPVNEEGRQWRHDLILQLDAALEVGAVRLDDRAYEVDGLDASGPGRMRRGDTRYLG